MHTCGEVVDMVPERGDEVSEQYAWGIHRILDGEVTHVRNYSNKFDLRLLETHVRHKNKLFMLSLNRFFGNLLT